MAGAWNISSTYRSDYTRNTTMRIMIDLVSMVRRLSKPFIGLGNSVLNRISLEAQIRAELANRIQRGEIQAADVRLLATPTMQVLGQLLIDLTITPVFEITEITERFGLAMPTA